MRPPVPAPTYAFHPGTSPPHSGQTLTIPVDAAFIDCLDACAHHEDERMDDRWLSVDEIAEYLGVSKDTVYTWVTSKGMPGHKVGRFWKFKREDVDAWVRDGGAASSSDELSKEPHRG